MYAVIDIGSNSMRLVLYKLADGEPRQMLNSKQPAGLAGYIDKEQQLTPRGVQKAVEVLQRFQAILDSVHPKRVYVFATASLRNIINTQEVLEEIRRICGLEVRVLTGQEEAIFDYFGALRTLNGPDGLLVDIGGGSTELVLFHDRQVTSACSLPMGSLNMYTRFVRDIIPTADELRDISRHAESLLKTVEFPAGKRLHPRPVWGGRNLPGQLFAERRAVWGPVRLRRLSLQTDPQDAQAAQDRPPGAAFRHRQDGPGPAAYPAARLGNFGGGGKPLPVPVVCRKSLWRPGRVPHVYARGGEPP